jgi:hypothetical protein
MSSSDSLPCRSRRAGAESFNFPHWVAPPSMSSSSSLPCRSRAGAVSFNDWVAQGRYRPRAPADPDLRISSIRFLDSRFRYARQGRVMGFGGGRGNLFSTPSIHSQFWRAAALDRRRNHLNQSRRSQ